MIEEEARTKLCHREIGTKASGGHCVGANCMAWRWSNRKLGHDFDHHLRTKSQTQAERDHAQFMRENPLHGYCGLAGQP